MGKSVGVPVKPPGEGLLGVRGLNPGDDPRLDAIETRGEPQGSLCCRRVADKQLCPPGATVEFRADPRSTKRVSQYSSAGDLAVPRTP